MKLLPSLKQLEYLVALADFEHFGKASQRCNITPSTLSVGIRDLENVLGVSLAERTKRTVLMTSIGTEIAARARLVLRDAEDLMELAASNREPMAGDMRLGVIPTISPFLLPRVLPALKAQYPALRLYLREEQSAPLLARLRGGEIDVALIALPYGIDGLASLAVFDDEFEFACDEHHALANETVVTASALANEPLMLLEEGHCLRGHALDACQLAHAPQRAQFEASSLHTLVQMVAAGIGVTLLPKLAIRAQITAGLNIKLVPLAFPAARQIGLVWRESSLRSREFAMLGDVLSDLAK
ncbi:MAG: LysR family hydrogen peroxide-inducible transcriptional activator [Gammaproteobacteria bacterium]|jgi:LysR family hydrogen peroxide-inducible transcriptional activator